MKAFKVFILGLIYGWLIKSVINRIYRDEGVAGITRENALLRERVRSLEAQLQTRSLASQPVTKTAPQSESIRIGTGKNDLKQIKGIGPATEKKLNDAGIHTFAEMAQLSVEELQNILGSSRRVAQSADELISQAKEFAQQ